MKIFISYRRADSTYLIGRIKDKLLSEFGSQSVFRDLDDIPGGVDFRTVLETATNECDVMLVVIGSKWAGITDADGNKRLFDPGDFTRIEVETGLKRLEQNKTAIFPVLINHANMPSAGELPESLGQLSYQNAVKIRDDPDFKNDIEKLIRDIRLSQGYVKEDISIQYFEPRTIYIPEGPFCMGSPTMDGIPYHEAHEHEVTLPAYRIGMYPVTNAQYEEFIRQTSTLVKSNMGWDGQRVPKGYEKHPVTGLTWYEALEYCQWLSKETDRQYTIPNEAQWEKACRGGKKSFYPWGDDFDQSRCNFHQSALASVDAYPPQNEYGCFDLVGNVRQWTCTLWGEKRILPEPKYAYPWKDDGRNDLEASRQIRRVVRGSSMTDDLEFLRCSARRGQAPDQGGLPSAQMGFRVALIV